MYLQVSGREVFEFRPELVDDDDAEADDTRYDSEEEEDDEEEVIIKHFLNTVNSAFLQSMVI